MARWARQIDNEPTLDSQTFTAVMDAMTVLQNPLNVQSVHEFIDGLLARGYVIAPITAVDDKIFADGYFSAAA